MLDEVAHFSGCLARALILLMVVALAAIVGWIAFQPGPIFGIVKPSFNPAVLPWWGWFLAGAIFWFFINTFALPDRWSVWLAMRRNGPVALFPLAILAILVGGGNLIIAAGMVFLDTIQRLTIQPWVWIVIFVGLLLAIPGGMTIWARLRSSR